MLAGALVAALLEWKPVREDEAGEGSEIEPKNLVPGTDGPVKDSEKLVTECAILRFNAFFALFVLVAFLFFLFLLVVDACHITFDFREEFKNLAFSRNLL